MVHDATFHDVIDPVYARDVTIKPRDVTDLAQAIARSTVPPIETIARSTAPSIDLAEVFEVTAEMFAQLGCSVREHRARKDQIPEIGDCRRARQASR